MKIQTNNETNNVKLMSPHKQWETLKRTDWQDNMELVSTVHTFVSLRKGRRWCDRCIRQVVLQIIYLPVGWGVEVREKHSCPQPLNWHTVPAGQPSTGHNSAQSPTSCLSDAPWLDPGQKSADAQVVFSVQLPVKSFHFTQATCLHIRGCQCYVIHTRWLFGRFEIQLIFRKVGAKYHWQF